MVFYFYIRHIIHTRSDISWLLEPFNKGGAYNVKIHANGWWHMLTAAGDSICKLGGFFFLDMNRLYVLFFPLLEICFEQWGEEYRERRHISAPKSCFYWSKNEFEKIKIAQMQLHTVRKYENAIK